MGEFPKRRKDKDNPYTLIKLENNNYGVSFKDGMNINRNIEIADKIFKQMNKDELEDKHQMNQYERYIEKNDVTELSLYKRAIATVITVEEEVEKNIVNEEVRNAIKQLSPVQKRRIIKYYFYDMNEYEIAEDENATQQAVNKSLHSAYKILYDILKNKIK